MRVKACGTYTDLDFKGLRYVSEERAEGCWVRSSENEKRNTCRILVGKLVGGETKGKL